MQRTEVNEIVSGVGFILENGGAPSEISGALQKLSTLISASAQDEHFRNELASDATFIDLCINYVTNSLLLEFKNTEETTLYVRLLRGALLFLRNLVASANSMPDITLLLLNIQHFDCKIKRSNPFFIRCLAAYIEVLANILLSQGGNHTCNLLVVSHTFSPMLELIRLDAQLHTPFTIFLDWCLTNEENVSTLLSEDANSELLNYVLKESFVLLESQDIDDDRITLVWERIITNKSYKAWLESQMEDHDFVSILKVAQLIATSGTEWDNIQCTVIMEWSFALLKKWSIQAGDLLLREEVLPELDQVHTRLVIVLDIISDLLKFNVAKQFLEHYNALEVLVKLFRAAHENGEILTMKSKISPQADSKQSKRFPMVKSLIVEILAFIVHQSFESQEKLRELHGLELLLSNCIIDENNPYIKERSILCLRFVLEGNPKNQQFVAQLEAKKVVDDLALQEVGYEVEVEDGQVRLKKTGN